LGLFSNNGFSLADDAAAFVFDLSYGAVPERALFPFLLPLGYKERNYMSHWHTKHI